MLDVVSVDDKCTVVPLGDIAFAGRGAQAAPGLDGWARIAYDGRGAATVSKETPPFWRELRQHRWLKSPQGLLVPPDLSRWPVNGFDCEHMMDAKRTTSISKFLSLVLRHEPGRIGITLDDAGWTDVNALLAASAAHGNPFTRDELLHVVATNDKKRFALSDDGTRIRASQGHSVSVELGYEPITPPEVLYHGTATRFVDSIRNEGLRPRERQHVHLSATPQTATDVGQRHGKPIVLTVRAGEMHRAGHVFHQSANGVWLTASVPAEFLRIPE